MSKTVEIKNGEDLITLVKRIDKGNPKDKDLEALSKELDKYPALYRSIGNIPKKISERILELLTPNSLTVRISIERNMDEMKSELGYTHSTFVEKMLIEEILLRWLRLHHAEINYNAAIFEKHTLELATFHEKRIDLHHKRYLRAVESLAKVRKMIAQTQAKGAEMFKNLTKQTN